MSAPAFVNPAPRKATSTLSQVSAPKSGTMALIDALVEKLPPFPLSAPLPEIGTTSVYHDKPCESPRPRYFPKGTCRCGYLMGEHPKGGAE